MSLKMYVLLAKDFFLSNLQKTCGNGLSKHIYSCNMKKCGLVNYFSPKDRAVSSCTKRIYDCITLPGTIYVNCHSPNVIYIITCDTCGLQYVGETVQKLNSRFTGHRAGIKNPKHGTCKILANHFNQGVCRDSKYSVQILEKLPGNVRTARNALDPTQTSSRKEREKHWMMTLRTVHPYGLNDRIGDKYKTQESQHAIGRRFKALKRSHLRISRGGSRISDNIHMKYTDFWASLNKMLRSKLKDVLNFIRYNLASMKKANLKKLADLVTEELSSVDDNFPYIQWYYVILDIVDTKFFKPPKVKPKRTPPKNVCHVSFDNKAIEMINLSSILNSSSVTNTIPSSAKNFITPTVLYSLTEPIGSKIFNFNKFVSSLDLSAFVKDNTILPCHCKDSPFKDNHHGHIISGDLRIVRDNKLRKIISKGPKFREPQKLDWDKARDSIKSGITDCVSSWCAKHRKNKNVLLAWQTEVNSKVDDRIDKLKTEKEQKETSSSKKCLKELLSKFVIAPIDKATGNVSFICQRFYALVLAKELGLTGSSSNTYVKHHGGLDKLVSKQAKDLQKVFKLHVDKDNMCLPHIYWLPKMHKNPIKFRFIIAAPTCSVKPLSKAVAAIFKQFYYQIEQYNKKSFFYSGVKTFWVIQNNEPVVESINKINKKRRAKSISTFDFSTLYTKIPHDKLIEVMNKMVDFCFQGDSHKVLSVSKSGCRWVYSSPKDSVLFDRATTKRAIKYLMNNCYFTCGKQVFRQVIGIPMGSDPAPFMANLFLYHYESKWLKELKKNNLILARKFSNTFRFIDDLNAMNDGGLFEQYFKDIYPPELELKKEHGNVAASFLDLDITLKDGQFDVKLFDKRDAFPFKIVRMPYRDSNMPSRIFYSSFGAEILRIARTSTESNSFFESAKKLLHRMVRQGANKDRIVKTLKQAYGRHDILKQFECTSSLFAHKIVE